MTRPHWRWLLAGVFVCLMSTTGWAQDTIITGDSDDEIIKFINQKIREGWELNEISPSADATEGEWLRRLYLDLLGRIPRLEETQEFLNDNSPNKRVKVVDEILYGEDYQMEFANHWSTTWTNILIGRNGGNDNDRPVNRAGLEKFLRDSFLRNRPYDKMVFELIAGNGNNTPGEPDFNGAVNFLLDNLQEMQVPATNKVSQIFLGMRVGCTQCHNHPFNDWKQDQFWSMNAFFKQAQPLRTFEGRDVVSAELQDGDFAGEDGNPEEAAIYYELRNGLLKVAYPRFVDGTRINPAGYADEVNRRDELGKLVVKSKYMNEALVNRMWGHFFGYGFTKPVDDMGPHNPPSHPELLERLAQEFAAYNYDLRKVMRWYVLSKPYALSSRMNSTNIIDDPSKGELPAFSHFYLRQMTAEQLYGSLIAATQVDQTGKTVEEQNRIRNDILSQFSINFGTDENDEATTFNGTIPQALFMMNGGPIQKATSVERGSFLYNIAQEKSGSSEKLNKLYLAALGRKPNSNEVNVAVKLQQARKGDTVAALQDIWWAILNSNEFIMVH